MIATSRLTGQELDIYILTTGRLKCAWFLDGQNEGAMLVALRLWIFMPWLMFFLTQTLHRNLKCTLQLARSFWSSVI